MRVWLITVGEPLPIDGPSVRLLRTGILAELLVEQDHEVLWWSSTFDHQKKTQRFDRDTRMELSSGLRLCLLHSAPYRRNISLARLRNHQALGRKFPRHAGSETPPDVILCSFPTIELSAEAVRYGERTGVPVILDVRDMWPDIFLNLLPSKLRWLGRLPLRQLTAETHFALRKATAVVAMSEGCLQWGLRYAQRDVSPLDAVYPLAYQKPTVPTDQLQAAAGALRRVGIDPTKRICWFIGTLGKHYDVATVIRVARAMARQGRQNVQFVLSGDGDQRSHLSRLADGHDNIIFTGWIDVPQIAYLMSVAAVGLVAVHGIPGTLPNKLFEYFSAGLPVLSSIRGEAAALIEQHDCGLNYQARQPNSLLDALSLLLDDEGRRRRMGANAQQLYNEHFSATVVYSKMTGLLSKVAGRPVPNPTLSEAISG